MPSIQKQLNQKICDDMTQIEIDLETTFKVIIEQAGNKIHPEKILEFERQIYGAKRMLEDFRHQYES